MITIFETCSRCLNILELVDILTNFYFDKSETERDY